MHADRSLAVSKRLDVDGYAYPSVVIRITVNGSGPVAVRLVESLPPGVDATAVGFHADEGYEHWAVADERRIVYENVVEASESVSTLYGIAVDPERLSASLDPPTVVAAPVYDRAALECDRAALDDRAATLDDDWTIVGDDRATLDDDRIDVTILDADGTEIRAADRQTSPRGGDWDGSDTTMNQDTPTDDAQDDEPSGEGDPNPEPTGPGASETTDSDEEVLYRGGSGAARATNGHTDPSTTPDPAGESGRTDDGSVSEVEDDGATRDEDECGSTPTDTGGGSNAADADGSRIEPESPETDRSGGDSFPDDLGDEETVAERVAFELRRDDPPEETVATLRSQLRPDTTGSVDAKLDHCLRRIGELDAYVDALEAFLGDEGTARQLLTDFRDDIDRVEARTEDVAERLDAAESAQSGLEARLTSVEAELEALDERVGDVEDLDESVSETRAELTDAVDEVESELARLGEEMESVEQWRATVVDALSGAASETGESGAD
ncbi:hypothetical protein I7X12_00505 [Halosimplex litoreum]|uniref:Uncharacterized protein n=1 Tax=Halosimplex litoreum TaxID=1198301 RepID=A0A7T3KVM3_9EURY|nr:hypothetical protein [Halosimplex litoreum]QPV63148.1 hypothetical protein I7X12_00505 [Halosimplex litoreum]